MPPNGRSLPSATHSGSLSMTPSSWAYEASRYQSGVMSGPWILRSASGADKRHREAERFCGRASPAMSGAHDIESLFAIWEQNVEAVRAINRSLKQDHLTKSGFAPQLVAHLKRCAIALVKPHAAPQARDGSGLRQFTSKIDKSVLTIGETKRIRCKEHLRFVASQPCLICGRTPSHAHHVRHAQPRGLGLKVSDEFTVPLCAAHHQQLHHTTKESDWWKEQNVDPLKIARDLWEGSLAHAPGAPSTGTIEAGNEPQPNPASKSPQANRPQTS